MPDFTPVQTVLAVLIIVFFTIFYLRRSWFWFWKATRLFKQFEEVEQITYATNQEVKELHQKLNDLIALLEKNVQGKNPDLKK